MIRRRKSILVEGIFGLVSIIILGLYLRALFSYLYDKYDIYQPPWPSKPVNITKYQDIISYETQYPVPRILCWISTYSRNRIVSRIFSFMFGFLLDDTIFYFLQKSEAVRVTWGQDCDVFLIMTSKSTSSKSKCLFKV